MANLSSALSNCKSQSENHFGKNRPSVKFDLSNNGEGSPRNPVSSGSNENNSLAASMSIGDMTKSQVFNKKYLDYASRVREVNKAKDLLRINRDKMSFEMKTRFVKHIKRKLNIIQMIEDELKIDA